MTELVNMRHAMMMHADYNIIVVDVDKQQSRLLDDANSNLMDSMMYSEWCAWQNDDEQLMRATVKNDDQRLMSCVDQQKKYWPEDNLQQ